MPVSWVPLALPTYSTVASEDGVYFFDGIAQTIRRIYYNGTIERFAGGSHGWYGPVAVFACTRSRCSAIVYAQ